MSIERTLVIIKPDGVRRGLIGEVISRFEKKGLRIIAMKMLRISREIAEKLYEEHRGKDFYEPLINFMISGPSVALVVEGYSAIEAVRNIIGPTNGVKAPPGTIRGDYALSVRENVVHASDSSSKADYEIKLFFSDEEIVG
ncbi:MAG: nucleoside-diphosphate kinase [Desulfurococcaceae archaeon]|uniref:Nucleoside diphosphate kinase n=1 Tax=Staphylothermus marinus TaxID=2280 RepID=A0A7C4NRJ0_STAMA